MTENNPYRFCVAPMMGWTDRHCRVFHRALSRHARIYTEMVTADAILYGDRQRLLGFDKIEHPIALQLGGSEPKALALASGIGAEFGYDEINLNIGCPSDRVQAGRFGACLMAEPHLVAECVSEMIDSVEVPVTVKCRIGIDDQCPEEALPKFLEIVSATGVQVFVIHARKAWLRGLSPKQNREVPPLDYALVCRMKARFPDLTFVLNGGIEDMEAAAAHLSWADGVMMGRAAYWTPARLMEVDTRLFGDTSRDLSVEAAVRSLYPYIQEQLDLGTPLAAITRHMTGLFQGRPGAKSWRRFMCETARQLGAGLDMLEEAIGAIEMGSYRMAEFGASA